MKDLWELLDELDQDQEIAKAEGRGGGGLIGLVKVELGYTFFFTGYNAAEYFVSIDSVASAKAALNKMREAMPAGANPSRSTLFTMYKDKTKGSAAERAPNWQGDRTWVFANWMPSWNDENVGVKQAMRGLSVGSGEHWLRLSFCEDPSGRTKANQEGQTVPELFPYPSDLYANEAEAQKAGEEQVAQFGESAVSAEPEPWLKDIAPKMVKDGMTAGDIAKKLDQPVAAVEAALKLAA